MDGNNEFGNEGRSDVLPEQQCRAEATQFLTEILGQRPQDLCWDPKHHLQGHAHAGDCELVVIAARDRAHHVVVLTAHDWDAVRRTPGVQRQQLLRDCAIDSHDRLEALLAAS